MYSLFCSFTCSLFLLSLLFQKNLILLLLFDFLIVFLIWCYCFALHSFLQYWCSFLFFIQCIFSKIYIIHFYLHMIYISLLLILNLNTYPFAVVYILVAHRPVGPSAFPPFLLFSFSRVSTFHVCLFSTFIPFPPCLSFCFPFVPASFCPCFVSRFSFITLCFVILALLHSRIFLGFGPLALGHFRGSHFFGSEPWAGARRSKPKCWRFSRRGSHFCFSDQNLGQVPGGDSTNCGDCHGMLSSVLSLERHAPGPDPISCCYSQHWHSTSLGPSLRPKQHKDYRE